MSKIISIYISNEIRAWIDCQPRKFNVSKLIREFLLAHIKANDPIEKLKAYELDRGEDDDF